MAYKHYFILFKRYRTPVLALIATVLLASSAVWSFDIPWQDILQYVLLSAIGVVIIALLAAVCVAIFKLLRKYF